MVRTRGSRQLLSLLVRSPQIWSGSASGGRSRGSGVRAAGDAGVGRFRSSRRTADAVMKEKISFQWLVLGPSGFSDESSWKSIVVISTCWSGRVFLMSLFFLWTGHVFFNSVLPLVLFAWSCSAGRKTVAVQRQHPNWSLSIVATGRPACQANS